MPTLEELAPEQLREVVVAQANNLELLTERMAELELALEDSDWLRVTAGNERDLSRDGLRKIVRLARVMFLKNPLIHRAVMLQAYYVWGQGVSIQARDSDIDAVVQAFLAEPSNRKVLTGHAARSAREVALQLDGNTFLALYTNRQTGGVRVRTFHPDEISDIVCNPEDSAEAWFYKREWTQLALNVNSGNSEVQQRTAYYPDWRYNPAAKPKTIGTHTIEWNTPIMHVSVGGLDGMKFGVPEVYAALDWARAYKSFLEDWASIVRSLQRFAWRLTTKAGKRGVAAAKTKLASTVTTMDGETNPPPTTGSTFVAGENVDMAPIPKTGANVNAEDGKMLRLMVAAATGWPDTMLSNDPQQGALATAKSLDRPTELMIRERQSMWAEVFRDLLEYVTLQATIAGGGALRKLANKDVTTTIDITFPTVLEHDIKEQVGAIVSAATLDGKPMAETMPPRTVSRLLLAALGVDDADELLDKMFGDGDGMQDDNDTEDPEQTPEEAAVTEQIAEALREITREAERIRAA